MTAPPGAQFRAFRHLLVEHFLRLSQIAGQVGDAGEEDGGRGQAAQQFAGVAQVGHMDLRESGAQTFQLLREPFAIAAPTDVVLHGDGFQVGAGHGLIAGMQNLLVTVLGDADFALDDGNSRAFDAAGHTEDCSGDGHAAIRGGDIQVAGTALGGLHDDAAASQADGEIARGLGAGESGTFAQFHHTAVLQLQHGVGIHGGADLDAVGEVLAGGQHLDSSGQDLIKRAVDGLHDGAAGVVAVLIHREPDGESGGHDHGGGHGPPAGIVDAARGGGRGHGNHPSLIHPAAGDARVQVVFHQQGASFRQMAGLELGNQRLEIGAGVQRGMTLRGQIGPHAGGGGFDYRIGHGVFADFDHGLLQGRVQGVVFGVHATPPM